MTRRAQAPEEPFDVPGAPFEVWVTLDYPDGSIQLEWFHAESGIPETAMRVCVSGSDELSWVWDPGGRTAWCCRAHAQ